MPPNAAPSWWIDTCFQFLDVCSAALRDQGLSVKSQGSFAQGLAVEGSDLDAVIYRKGFEAPKGKAVVNALTGASRRVMSYVNNGKGGPYMHLRTIERVPWARIPLVKLQFTWGWPSGRGKPWTVEVDLSYGDETRGSYDTRIGTLVSSQPQLRTFLQTIKGWALSQEEGILNSQRQALSTFALILLGLCYYNRNLRREQPVEVDGFFHFITREIGNLDASVCHIWVEEGQLKHVVDEEDDEDRSRLTRSPLKILVPGEGPESNAARSLSRKMWMQVVYPAFERARPPRSSGDERGRVQNAAEFEFSKATTTKRTLFETKLRLHNDNEYVDCVFLLS
ncbi:hypothetical protein Pmar_PMAR006062 [Perkinsus marinus ATCC 50983]|uniref:Polymerase nucleotidyl transferase domain-containing protein n=1 Tax=Perkinsus marinus (strain ATCC 50983 / TXsc) TaxID=423536 RepID=C5LA41_PERM5|nr:hypothetical protein Pmar_PMAR006062 [Perkinsus marinus ATCC 50983]EER06297.1 hypothetical protein Pmar_PMAR006062 [Perkinsus marinus ATCC 50983]|eukprot:XP_002774481.1 hypothetical protein Pmar_PMAR006062 [Perkinsus marinus ATCC 50983]